MRSLYLHAPFCVRRCRYCDFAVTVDRAPLAGPWIEALGRERVLLEREPDPWWPEAPLETVFVGGGTPSLLGPDAMAGVARVLGGELLSDPALEWTVEANPESLTEELAAAWRRAGVNRLSIGVQSFSGSVLRWMGRLHGADGARRAVAAARAAGFGNWSVDLIFGLPDRLERDWRADLDAVLELGAPHVSLYGLTAEDGTPLGREVAEGREALADPERYRDEYLEAAAVLVAAGYEHYEVSNFALPGRESRHNAAYWSGVPYLGMGNSAHSFRDPVRRWNVRDWARYRDLLAEGILPVEDGERVEGETRRLEQRWLGLRTRAGLPIDGLPAGALPLVERWVREGLARREGGRLVLTEEGWLGMDRLTVDLDAADGAPPEGPSGGWGRSPISGA